MWTYEGGLIRPVPVEHPPAIILFYHSPESGCELKVSLMLELRDFEFYSDFVAARKDIGRKKRNA
jgi:hypothetical protein